MKKWKIYKYILTAVSILLLLYMICNMIYAASFTVFVADDLSNAITIGKFHVPFSEYLLASFQFTKKEYLNWQGTYSSLFAQALLSPLNNFGFRQLRCVMAFNALFFFINLVILLFVCMHNINKEYYCVKMSIAVIVISMFCSYDAYREVFFWYTGAISYCFPISLLFCAVALFLGIEETKKNGYIILSIILGILAMGGSLAISALGCFFSVLVWIYIYISKKKIPVKHSVVTGVWIVAAGFNAMAPGNFLRHERYDQTGLHPLNALITACEMSTNRWQFFFSSTNFAFLLFFLVLIGCYIEIKNGITRKNYSLKNMFYVAVVGLFAPIITAFPIALGYSSDMSLPNRCEFVIDSAIILSTTFLAFLSGIVLIRITNSEQRRNFLISLGMILIATFMLDGYGFNNIKIREIARELNEHTYQDHYYSCKKFVLGLEQYDSGEDVRIPLDDFPNPIDNTLNLTLSTNPDFWVNQCVAQYYGFSSIALYSEE